MTTRHSLFTRSLSLLLALIMVFSNMSGLTLRAEAADMDLGDILDKQLSVANKPLYDALANAETAMPVLAGMLSEPVEYPEDYPEEDDLAGAFVNGYLSLEPINGWVPTYYNEDGFNDIPYEGAVQLDAELEYVSVTYEKDLGVTEQAEAVYAYLKTAGQEAAAQTQLLDRISNATALTALGYLDVYFIEDMIDTVDALEEVDGFTAEELADIKADYKDIIAQLLDRLVEPGNPYMSFQAGKYEECLVVYAMLAQYDAQGLPHYYQQRDYINAELRDLSKVLYEILGEDNEYVPVVDAILVEMKEDRVTPANLEDMAERMANAANGLPGYDLVEDFDVNELGALNALFYAEDAANMPIAQLSYTAVPKMVEITYCEVYNEFVEETEPTETEPTEPELGSKENPIFIQGEMFFGDVPAGKTVYFAGYVGGMGVEVFVSAGPQFLDASLAIDGVAVEPVAVGRFSTLVPAGMGRTPVTFAVTNNSNTNGRVQFSFFMPLGSMENPAPLAMGENKAVVGANSNGYVYTWTAEEDGILVIEMKDSNWMYVINNMTAYQYGDTQWSDSEPVVNPAEVKVAAGDEIQVIVSTYDPTSWATPAGTITFDASVKDEEPTVPSEPAGCQHEDLVHVPAVAPTCETEGNIEHWYCPDCEIWWQDADLTQITNAMSVKLGVSHDIEHVAAVAATCHDDGNVEYWYCVECGAAWTDELLRFVTNLRSVIVPATGEGNVVHMEAVEPGCHYEGNVEYWVCYNCEKVWADEDLTQLSNIKNVVVPAVGSEMVVHMAAVEPGCHYEGNVEYWFCGECAQVWTDEALTQLSNVKNVILPAVGGEVEHVAAKAATCFEEGNNEYWFCESCEKVWQDEALTQLTNIKNVVLPIVHAVEHVEAVEPTCDAEGNIEYWYCTECGAAWTDELLREVTNLMSVKLPVNHNVEHVAAVEPGCENEGNIEYWYCTKCGAAWTDELLRNVTNLMSVKLGIAHTVEHVAAKAATCDEEGNVEYWYCVDCGTAWTDESLSVTSLTNLMNVKLPIVHSVEHVEAKAATCFEEGNIEYWYCVDCGTAWTDESLSVTSLTNIKNVVLPIVHAVEHVEAVEPGCENEGNIEYWYCTECGAAWTDELLRNITNLKSVVLPISHNVEHVAAVEPGCENEGNIEYWYCTECGMAWTDESLSVTSLTNLMSVKLPITHKIEHVEAAAATCYENGNIEYWYCTECGAAWMDESLSVTSLTNLKNVVLASGCKTIKHVRAVKPTCTSEGNIKYWYCADCERVWQDEARTQLTNFLNVVLPASCQNIKHVAAKEATCFEEGNIEHWYCVDCLTFWQDENKLQITNSKNVVVPAAHAELTHVEAVAATCEEDGNIEYWFCADCGMAWLDAEGIRNTNLMSVVTPAAHGEINHHAAVRAKCTLKGFVDGNIEYWDCAVCGTKWSDADCTNEVEDVTVLGTHMPSGIISFIVQLFGRSVDSEIICAEFDCAYCGAEKVQQPAAIEEVVVNPATCTEEGLQKLVPTVVLNGVVFTAEDTGDKTIIVEDENGEEKEITTNVNAEENLIVEELIPAKEHQFEHVAAVKAQCHAEGNLEYWHCLDSECDEYFIDEAKATPVAKEATVVPALGGDVDYRWEDICTTEHWTCYECGKYWLDEALTIEAEDPTALIHHVVEHVPEVVGCHDWGNAEYWACVECGAAWLDADQQMPTNRFMIMTAPAGAELVHVEAVAKTCFEEGYIEHWYCEQCERVWSDAEEANEITFDDIAVEASHAELVHVEAKAATCFENGNIEYWYCPDCGMAWLDAEGIRNTNLMSVVLPMAHGELVHVEAVEATCYENGNIEYWTCPDCGYAWLDAEGIKSTNLMSVVLPMAHGELIHVEAKAATCFEQGNVEHWYCETCEVWWLDEGLTKITNSKSVITPIIHNVEYVAAKEANCYETGNIEYWYCADCGFAWLDELQHLNTNLKAVVLPINHANLVHMDAVEPACHYEGSIEHWICYACEQVWQNEALTELTNVKNVILPRLSNEAEHVPAKEWNCLEAGNIEYWYCDECEQFWADEALTQITNRLSVIRIDEHTITHFEAIEPGCHYSGQVEHWACDICGTVWVDEALTQRSNKLSVILPRLSEEAIHVEAKDPTCYENGNVEYWVCFECEQFWTDAALTQLTNSKNVTIAAAHTNLVHMEAVEPGCHYAGNVEYWVCYDCEGVWTDELLRQVSNIKNVIIPEKGNDKLEHYEALEPDTKSDVEYHDGNVEYWYCPECEQVWTDEARTQLSNRKNVIIPSVDKFGGIADTLEYEFNEEHTVFTGNITLGRGIWTIQLPIDPEMQVFVNGVKTPVTVSGGRAKAPGQSVSIEIVNKSYDDVEYTLEAKYALGHRMNPEIVKLADLANKKVAIEAGTEGYHLVIEDATIGTYYLNISGDNWSGYIFNQTTNAYSDTIWSDEAGTAYACAAKAGQNIEIVVNTYDPASPWSAPAGEVEVTVTMKNPVTVNFKALLVNTTTSSNLASSRYPIGYKLTKTDLEDLINVEKDIETWFANYKDSYMYFFNEEAFFENVGYVVAERNNNPQVKLSYAAYIGDDNVKVELDDEGKTNLKNLGYTTIGLYNAQVNDTILTNITIEDKFALVIGESNSIEILKQVTALDLLASELEKMGAGEYEVITAEDGAQSLVANMTATQLVTFAQGVFDTKFNGKDNAYLPAKLGENNFIYSDGGLQIKMNALVQAILGDEQFTNESLAALANNGKGALVHTTLNTALFSAPFTINLTGVPAQMKDMASVLEKAESHFQFQGGKDAAGNSVLSIDVKVPEKAYEALTGYALITGNMDKASVEAIANKAALTYVEETLAMLMQEDITTQTYTNTLQKLGINKDLNSYADVYELLKDIVHNGESQFVPGDKTSEVDVSIAKLDINNVLPLVGIGDSNEDGLINLDDIEKGANKWVADDFITINTEVTIVNEAPIFDAIVIQKEASLSAFNMTTNLAAQLASVNNAAAIMLVNDVNGDLVFNHTTILDLNGKTVNGSIIANAPVIITDSSIETVSGAKVTGSVSGNATILAGTYGSDVSAFLRDGFYQENGAVKHALFTIEGGKLLVDPSIYVDNVDGYLPAAQYMAVEIAADIALNYYTAAGLYVNGKYSDTNMLYNLNIEDLVALIGNKDAGQIADTALSFINAPEFSDFVNKILADLINVDAVAASVKTGEIISTYNFQIHPWSLAIEHVMPEDYLTANISANEGNPKNITLGLAMRVNTDKVINVPKTDLSFTIQELLDEMAKIVVSENDSVDEATFVEVWLNQPVREGKTLVVGGSADALIHLDFSHNENYNRLLGAALAYFYEDLTKDLVKNGCIVELNQALASVTVGEFFGTLNKVVQNKDVSFEKIAAKLNLDLSASELAKLNKAYAMFQNGLAKVINKFDLDVNEATPLSDLMDNEGKIVADGNIQYHSADAYYKGYGVKAELDHINVALIIELAQGEHTIEHVAAKEATCFEEGNIEYWYCTKCGYAWLDADLTRNTNLKAVILPMAHAELTHVEAKEATCFEEGNIEYWFCADCGMAWLDAAGTLNTNLKAVILPMAHGEIIHVKAVAPTCNAMGNIEYWYCEDCGMAWLDEACTLNTNMMAVKLPVDEDAHVAGEVVIEKTVDGYLCQHDEVVYCTVCEEELSRETVGGLLGDANCDGEVDNIDAMLIARYDVGLTAANKIHLDVCDVNGDGDVDNIDAMLVARYDVGFTSKYPIGQEIDG